MEFSVVYTLLLLRGLPQFKGPTRKIQLHVVVSKRKAERMKSNFSNNVDENKLNLFSSEAVESSETHDMLDFTSLHSFPNE